jgi:hypothetical protein
MMTLASWVRSGAVSGVECPVRQFGPAFRWNSRRDWIGRDGKEPENGLLDSLRQDQISGGRVVAAICCAWLDTASCG